MIVETHDRSPITLKRQSVIVRGKVKGSHSRARKNATLLAMGAPGLLLILLFSYVPMLGLVIAFQDYKAYQGIWGSAWVGLQNFRFLFSTPDAWRVTYNTLTINAVFIITTLLVSLLLALLINEVRDHSPWLAKFYQSTFFFPYFISWVIVGYFVFAFLNTDNGLLDRVLVHLGFASIDWYASPQYWPIILTLVNLWKGVGL